MQVLSIKYGYRYQERVVSLRAFLITMPELGII